MKMNLSMDFLRPMAATMKKYSALMPSVVITIVALLLFLPTMLVGKKVSEKMETSAKTASSLQSIERNVPSKYERQQVQDYMDEFEEEVSKIKESAIQSSQRDLITYDYKFFPEPEKGESDQIYFGFGKQYRTAIEKLIEAMNALDAPSDSEIRALTGAGRRPDAGMGMGRQNVDVQDPMVDAQCLKRAKEISVYANPSAFQWYEFWQDYEFSGKDQALEDCWDSQVAFWIYDDIVKTIQTMNGTSSKVLTTPVKRLLGVRFTGPVTIEGSERAGGYFGGRTSMAGRDVPNYVTAPGMSNLMENSPTGRICDENIDIIHFAVSVVVDSRFFGLFMKELCSEKPHTFYPSVFKEPFIQEGQPVEAIHNQISILQSNLKVIDKTAPEHELYRYGKGGVIRLDLICEYLLDRAGYDMIKPEQIKERLGQSVDESEDGGQQPGQTPGGMPGMPGMPMGF